MSPRKKSTTPKSVHPSVVTDVVISKDITIDIVTPTDQTTVKGTVVDTDIVIDKTTDAPTKTSVSYNDIETNDLSALAQDIDCSQIKKPVDKHPGMATMSKESSVVCDASTRDSGTSNSSVSVNSINQGLHRFVQNIDSFNKELKAVDDKLNKEKLNELNKRVQRVRKFF